MHPEMMGLKCVIMRGGTSKAIFFHKNELPMDPVLRDKVLLAVFGSPDIRQIDGLGGADVLTSKLAIVGPASKAGADVDYTFGQVSFVEPIIDYTGNCGNISSAVGAFAIDEGMIEAVEPETTVRIHLTNSGQIITAQVPVKNGKAAVCGECCVDGVPGFGARVIMDWSQIVGTVTGKLLPTGSPLDTLLVDGKEYTVSLVDAGNPTVFIRAEALDLCGAESPDFIESNAALMSLIEKIRGAAAVKMGMISSAARSVESSPYVPFFAIVGKPIKYATLNHAWVSKDDYDISSRLVFMQRMHKSYPVTGAVCTGAAARITGTIVNGLIEGGENRSVRIGHPGGVMPVEAVALRAGGEIVLKKLGVFRTARRIMDGTVYIKKEVLRN